MDIITIFQALFRWGIPALAAGVAVLLALVCVCLVCKKVFHKKKLFTKVQVISLVLLCSWLILVLGLTSLSRGSNFTGSINLDFLSGYISAWNNWSVSELQMIIFNMLMFAPLGFLLPLLWKKAEKIWVAIAVSLSLTAFIEIFQFITGTGIFELDDLFHNLIGSIFGYFCIMAILAPVRERTIRLAPLAKALSIPFVISIALGVIFCVYACQPYGNMSILPAVKQDMSKVQIVTDLDLSEQGSTAAVYKSKYAEDKFYVEDIKSQLAQLEGLTFSKPTRREDENLGYTGTDANGAEFQMIFFFRSGEWNYTIFAENAAPLTQADVQQYKSRYENWMKENGLLPEKVKFSVQNGDTLRWDVAAEQARSAKDEAFEKGSVMIQVKESGNLSNFYYQICWNEYVATENIISESEAYAQVKQGNFDQYVPFQPGDTLCVNACEVTYVYDTKGFYQPVYQFSGYINDKENLWVCSIPALRK